MDLITIYGFVVVGILCSILIPILRQALPKPTKDKTLYFQDDKARFLQVAKPYLIILGASLVIGVLVVAIAGELLDWKSSILAGFTWDSLLQKVQARETHFAFLDSGPTKLESREEPPKK